MVLRAVVVAIVTAVMEALHSEWPLQVGWCLYLIVPTRSGQSGRDLGTLNQ